MDNGINFWLGFLIIITSCLTQELTTADYLVRNIRSNSNEESTTTDSSINSSISPLEGLIDLNQINNGDPKDNNETDYVNENFIEDQIALESNDKLYNGGSVKYNILPPPIKAADVSATNFNLSSNIDSDISDSEVNSTSINDIKNNSDIESTSKSITNNDNENKNSSQSRTSEYNRLYDKYTSPEFQRINNVYKYEASPEISRYTSSELYDEISKETKLNTKTSRSNIYTNELTTPTTLIFDKRHEGIRTEIVDNINENDALLITTNIPVPNEIVKSPARVNQTINYTNLENIDQYDSINAASRHSKLIIQNSTYLNIESKYLINKTLNEPTLSPKMNELDYLTISPTTHDRRYSVKTNENTNTPQISAVPSRARFSVKTIENEHTNAAPQTSAVTSRARFSVKPIENDESNEKNTTIKKPTVKWKSHYLSTQTPTSINPVYENLQKNKTFTTNIIKRGSIKYTDTLVTTTIPPETTTTTISDSIVQENQQHAVHVLPPDDSIFDILNSTEDTTLISTTTIDNLETTTLSENIFDVEILDSSTNDSVTDDPNSFTVEIDLTTENPSTDDPNPFTGKTDLTTENPSTTTSDEIESTTVFTNRISLLDFVSTTTPFNYEFSTEVDLSTTTERILISTVNNNDTILTTNIPSNDDISSEVVITSTEASTIIPEISTVTTNIIPITLSSVLESNSSSTSEPNVYATKNTSLIHEDDNLSFINTQQSSENTIKTGKSNYLTPTSEEDDDIKVKFPTESSTTVPSIIHSSSILTTINYKNIDDNNLHEAINKKSKITTTTTLPPPLLSSSTISNILETTTHGYDYKYGHKTSENNVYKHFSTADENNIHTNAPHTTVTTTTTTESTVETMNPLDDQTNPITIIAIIIITIAAICLILLALLLIIMRKRQKRFNYGQRCTPVSLDAYSLDSVSVYNSVRRKGAIRASKRSYGNPAFEDTENLTHPMNFSKLSNFAHNDEGIAKEYEDIPVITAQASEVPHGCESKNRFANVIPLPETRVYLTKIEGDINSDYINANFIRGAKNSKAFYIATQAPLENTIDDFWRMIWEQQSKLVIQVTELYENGVEKCVDYLPPSEVLDCHRQFGDFQITLKKREVKEKYIIHSIQLKNMVSNSWREITHLWYLGWPERGVPSEVDSIIAFLIEARSYTKTNTNNSVDNDDDKIKESANGYLSTGDPNMGPTPIVVHCSPGTGRTGTIITCDILMREFELTRVIDVPKIVYRIRRDRAGAVQTKDQYAYIYKVINVYATKLTGGALDSI